MIGGCKYFAGPNFWKKCWKKIWNKCLQLWILPEINFWYSCGKILCHNSGKKFKKCRYQFKLYRQIIRIAPSAGWRGFLGGRIWTVGRSFLNPVLATDIVQACTLLFFHYLTIRIIYLVQVKLNYLLNWAPSDFVQIKFYGTEKAYNCTRGVNFA
jgi:hypothetical protein